MNRWVRKGLLLQTTNAKPLCEYALARSRALLAAAHPRHQHHHHSLSQCQHLCLEVSSSCWLNLVLRLRLLPPCCTHSAAQGMGGMDRVVGDGV